MHLRVLLLAGPAVHLPVLILHSSMSRKSRERKQGLTKMIHTVVIKRTKTVLLGVKQMIPMMLLGLWIVSKVRSTMLFSLFVGTTSAL